LHVCPFSNLQVATVDGKFSFQNGAVIAEGIAAAAIPDASLERPAGIVGAKGDASGIAGQRLKRLRLQQVSWLISKP
jgi:hypothetical protein